MSNVRYRKLPTHDHDCQDTDETDGSDFTSQQFDRPAAKIPWRAISYAVILFVGGTVLLAIGSLIMTGHIDSEKHGERFWPLVLLGALMFIPGSYHTFYAYKAFSGDPDWRFEDFPDF